MVRPLACEAFSHGPNRTPTAVARAQALHLETWPKQSHREDPPFRLLRPAGTSWLNDPIRDENSPFYSDTLPLLAETLALGLRGGAEAHVSIRQNFGHCS